MQRQELTDFLKNRFPDCQVREDAQYPELTIPCDKIAEVASELKNNKDVEFDFLISVTAVDYKDKFTMVYHLESTKLRQLVVLKSDITDRENPAVDTVSGIWPAAGPLEREVYDLFGIKFKGHADLRRLFLDEGYGFPLRKDFSDETRVLTLSGTV
jgi:NADH:ubiquinone oxidoreductase subunit C